MPITTAWMPRCGSVVVAAVAAVDIVVADIVVAAGNLPVGTAVVAAGERMAVPCLVLDRTLHRSRSRAAVAVVAAVGTLAVHTAVVDNHGIVVMVVVVVGGVADARRKRRIHGSAAAAVVAAAEAAAVAAGKQLAQGRLPVGHQRTQRGRHAAAGQHCIHGMFEYVLFLVRLSLTAEAQTGR